MQNLGLILRLIAVLGLHIPLLQASGTEMALIRPKTPDPPPDGSVKSFFALNLDGDASPLKGSCHRGFYGGLDFADDPSALPELNGEQIYALVRPKSTQTANSTNAALAEYQEEALERIVRCKLGNALCFKPADPKPRVGFGKFCWRKQSFAPLQAGISQLRCRVPPRPSDPDASAFWQLVLGFGGNSNELELSITNYFLSSSQPAYNAPVAVSWASLLTLDAVGIAAAMAQMLPGPDPMDPMFPLNPLFPYSPLNPYLARGSDGLGADETGMGAANYNGPIADMAYGPGTGVGPSQAYMVNSEGLDPSLMSPYSPYSPFYPLNAASPFSLLNPANPFNAQSPVIFLPPADPFSPFNPASPFYPLDANSPFNPENIYSPMNRGFDLPGPPPCSPLSPMQPGFILHPENPLYPLNPLGQLPLLPESSPFSPMNPMSPFYPLAALNPLNPLPGLDTTDPRSPLNVNVNPANYISGEPLTITPAVPAPNHYNPAAEAANALPPSWISLSSASTAPASFLQNLAGNMLGRLFMRYVPDNPGQGMAGEMVDPCDPRSPYFAGNEYSPFHPTHPSNPYSFLNPLNQLPPSDPLSPYNPGSPNFAGNPDSPYHPLHPMNPFNPDSFLHSCTKTGSISPYNPGSPFFPLTPKSPFSPQNPSSPYSAKCPLLSGILDPSHALNPSLYSSPFHPRHRASPYNPQNIQVFNPSYPLSPFYHQDSSSSASIQITLKRPETPNSNSASTAKTPEIVVNPAELGWKRGVKEDWDLIAKPKPADPSNVLIPVDQGTSSAATAACGPVPPAPPPPQPPYYPGYFVWDPSWPEPRFMRTSAQPTLTPMQPGRWNSLWEQLWLLRCRRASEVASEKGSASPLTT